MWIGVIWGRAGETIEKAADVIYDGTSFAVFGVISEEDDVDVYRLIVPSSGTVVIKAEPWSTPVSNEPVGNNLDVSLQLRNSGNTVIASSSPVGSSFASLTLTLAAGTYFIFIDGVGDTVRGWVDGWMGGAGAVFCWCGTSPQYALMCCSVWCVLFV